MALTLMAIPIIGELLKSGMDIIDKMVPDKDAAAKAKQELLLKSMEFQAKALDIAAEQSRNQTEVNKVEAASQSIFVAGWRPFIGWVCGLGWCYNFLAYPALQWYAAVYAPTFKYPPPLSDMLIELTFGMLGLATIRTFEKLGKLGKTGVK